MGVDFLRWRSKIRASVIHLSLSAVVALIAAALVFFVWYAFPYRALSGGQALLFVVISVDVVLGPLLTFVVFDKTKSKKELTMDLALIVLLQSLALGYGMWSVYQARPIYLVHEVDRFVVVSAADIDPKDLNEALPEFRSLPFSGVRLVGVRESKNGNERLKSFELALAGKDRSLRPNYWQNLSNDNKKVLRERAKPLRTLMDRSKSNQEIIQSWLNKEKKETDQLLYLPVVSRGNVWTAVLDQTSLEISGYLPIDGF